MPISIEELEQWMKMEEGEHIEFKEGKEKYDVEKLAKYCIAIANEKGGTFILGVTDKLPREVVGTQAFESIERIKKGLYEKTKLRIEVSEIDHPEGRVLVFEIPSRPTGKPLEYRGAFWMRIGESLEPMSHDQILRISEESHVDFSAEICPGASINDLDREAIDGFRNKWAEKAGIENLQEKPLEQILNDAELINGQGITYAGLVLFGKEGALGKYLPNAEVIYEYRNDSAKTSYDQRVEYRKGYFLYYEDIWNRINQRNDNHQLQSGLFQISIPTINEAVVREAILNAVSHRDYRRQGSIFCRQDPGRIVLESPGGFPDGVTIENLLWKQVPRNRRLAQALSMCGLVERAGQGFDRIYEMCIREGKALPDFARTDDYQVWISLNGVVEDEAIILFLDKVEKEKLAGLIIEDFLVLNYINKEQDIPENLSGRRSRLLELGIIESIGRGRGTRYILSRKYYSFIGRPGVYTRRKGLDRETNKALLLKHIGENPGCRLRDLLDVLPSLNKTQIQNLMRDLKKNEKIFNIGQRKGARWYAR